MADFQRVASTSDLQNSEKMLVEIQDELYILIKVDDEYFCLDDICTHDGGTLSEGELCGHAISCPRHGAKFNVQTGAAISMPATQATGCHEVKVDGEDIYVKLQD